MTQQTDFCMRMTNGSVTFAPLKILVATKHRCFTRNHLMLLFKMTTGIASSSSTITLREKVSYMIVNIIQSFSGGE